MITLTQVMEKLAERVRTSDLPAWCQAKYGKPLTIYIGVDFSMYPGEKESPCIMLQRTEHDGMGRNSVLRELKFLATCCITQEKTTETTGPDYKQISYDGVDEIEHILYKITEILGKMPPELQLQTEKLHHHDTDDYPVFYGFNLVNFKIPVAIGGFEPECLSN